MVTTTLYQASQERFARPVSTLQSDKVSTSVYVTQTYTQFSFDPINRPIDKDKLEKLYDAVSKKNLLADNPILVSLTFVVIDGQHRLRVAEALNVPIYYQFASDTQVEDIPAISHNRSAWRFNDYLESWCARGNPEYLRLREFVRRYNWMIPSIAMDLCYYGARGYLRGDFANGRYLCNDFEFAEKVALAMLDFRAMGFKHWKSRVFTYAVSQLLANADYDHEVMMRRLEGNREALHPAVSTDDYFVIFNRIYNHKARSGRIELKKLTASDPKHRADKKAERPAKLIA